MRRGAFQLCGIAAIEGRARLLKRGSWDNNVVAGRAPDAQVRPQGRYLARICWLTPAGYAKAPGAVATRTGPVAVGCPKHSGDQLFGDQLFS